MDVYTHTFFAVALCFCFYCFGRRVSHVLSTEKAINNTLDKLEFEGLIKIRIGKNGEKDIVPIRDIEREAISK